MYATILVPTDGSESADRAVEHGLELAEQHGGTLHTLYVVDTHRYGEPALSSTELVLQDLEAFGSDLVTEVAERAGGVGVETVTSVCHGTPHEEILDYADEIDADIVVMGFQGQSHRLEGHMGSVADLVTRRSDRPVLTA